jgi:hypothetical protein
MTAALVMQISVCRTHAHAIRASHDVHRNI